MLIKQSFDSAKNVEYTYAETEYCKLSEIPSFLHFLETARYIKARLSFTSSGTVKGAIAVTNRTAEGFRFNLIDDDWCQIKNNKSSLPDNEKNLKILTHFEKTIDGVIYRLMLTRTDFSVYVIIQKK
jgi:hypothetical protein